MTSEHSALSAGFDYGYDLAHDVQEPERPRTDRLGQRAAPPATGGRDYGSDHGYDEAHDVPST